MNEEVPPQAAEMQAEYNLRQFLLSLEMGERHALRRFEMLPVAARIIALANGGHDQARAALAHPKVARIIRNRPVLKGLVA